MATPDDTDPIMAQSAGPQVQAVETDDADRRAREAYFTASQRQLIWARFKKQKAALVAAWRSDRPVV